jgi:hypothetical protein
MLPLKKNKLLYNDSNFLELNCLDSVDYHSVTFVENENHSLQFNCNEFPGIKFNSIQQFIDKKRLSFIYLILGNKFPKKNRRNRNQ